MALKSERFELRLDEETLQKVDEWRGNQRDLPSRAEAMRRLVDEALSRESRVAVELSDGEKLIISMIGDVHRHLKVRGEVEPEFISKAISGGHYWALRWQMPGLFEVEADDPKDLGFVLDVLDMWDSLERAHEKLPVKEKARVKKDGSSLGERVRFPGFDGNTEGSLMGIAYFLVNDMKRFETFKRRELNSHMPIAEAYRRMLAVYMPIRNRFTGAELTADQIIQILNAFPHPRNRAIPPTA